MGFAGCAAASKVLMTNPATKTCTAAICTAGECCVARKTTRVFVIPLSAPRRSSNVARFLLCKINKQAGGNTYATKGASRWKILFVAFLSPPRGSYAPFFLLCYQTHVQTNAAAASVIDTSIAHSATRLLRFQG